MTTSIALLPPEHPQRLDLADEVHARPSEALATPSRASYVALLIEPAERDGEAAQIAALCRAHGAAPPVAGSTHYAAQLGALKFKWERHGEFSSYTFFLAGAASTPWDEAPARQLPPGWLAALPGRTLVAAHAELIAAPAAAVPDAGLLARHFGEAVVVGADVGEGAGLAYTDFRVQPDGFSRFLLLDRSFTPRQAGRMLQRLFEIEAYRMMALLALPIARRQAPRLAAIEAELARLTVDIADATGDDEDLLHDVTRLAADVERGLSASQFRFAACRAYDDLVTTRIAELREQRLPGIQTIGEFMARRFRPAVATCATVSQRLHDLSERVAQASGLLSTRVDLARERPHQARRASMDRRAQGQLRLPETVEGLSVAAIDYYSAGLVGYLAKGLKSQGLPVDPELVVALAIPLLTVLVMLSIRRARRHVFADGEPV
ncbi:MAG: DUF3422 domain-containing protein [Nevskia sp.]